MRIPAPLGAVGRMGEAGTTAILALLAAGVFQTAKAAAPVSRVTAARETMTRRDRQPSWIGGRGIAGTTGIGSGCGTSAVDSAPSSMITTRPFPPDWVTSVSWLRLGSVTPRGINFGAYWP